MTDDDFKQTMLDYIGMVAPERHRQIMAAQADVKAGHEAILAKIEDLVKNNGDALDVLRDTAGAGHSEIMDEVVADQQKVLAALENASGVMKSRIAATPLPGKMPGPQ